MGFESLLLPLIITFIVTVAFMIALRPLAANIGLIDHPSGRKRHIGAVPIIGGMAMFIGVLAGFVMVDSGDGVSVGLIFSFFCWS